MNDQDKEQLLAELRQRVAELEALEAERKLAEEKASLRAENLKTVSELAVRLAAVPPETDFFRLIAETLKSITGALATSVSAYDTEAQEIVVQHVAVDAPILARINKLLGHNIVGMRAPISADQLETVLTEVVTTEEDLTGISFGAIPKSVATVINRAFNLGCFAGLSLQYGGKLMGTAVIVMPKGEPALSKDLIKVFAHVVAVSLHRREVEKALRASEAEYKSIVELAPNGIITVDLEGMVTSCNTAFLDLSGYSRDEIVGRHFSELPTIRAEDIPKYVDVFRSVIGEGTSQSFQFLWERKGGTTRWGDICVSLIKQNSTITGVQAVVSDITERKQAEEALRESETRFRTLSDATFEGIAFTEQGVIVDANRQFADLLGYGKDEIRGLDVRQLVAPEDQEFVRNRILSGSEEPYEHRALCKDGTVIFVEIRPRMMSIKGQPMRVTAVRDITERKRAEEALRQHTAQLEALRQVGLELAAQLDLDTLLHFIASQAVELLQGTAGGLYLYRPDRDMLEWTVAVGPHMAPLRSVLHRGEGLSGRVWETGETLIVDDYEHWEGRATIYNDYVFAAVVAVPIRWGDEFLGVLNVLAEPPRTFSRSDAELLDLFATQAAVAVRNARLLQAEREQRELTEALVEASAIINSVLVPDIVLDYILEQVQRIVAADSCSVMLLTEDGTARVARWRGQEQMGLTAELITNKVPVDAYPELVKMIQTGEPVVTIDTAVSHAETGAMPEEWRGVRSHIGAPIRTAGQTVGFLNVSSTQPGRFDATDAQRLQAFANQAAIAIENSRLHRELTGYAEQLEQRVQERTAELQAQYARLDAILGSTTDGIVVADDVGNIVRANPVVQTWLTQTLSPEDADHLREAIRDLALQTAAQVASTKAAEGERPEKVLELTGIDLKLNAAPLVGEGTEEAPATVMAIHDVSHLRALNRMKTRFITNISHELRTPIATIKLYAHLMQKQPQRWQDHLDTLAEEADHLARLVEGILEISQVDAGRLELNPRPVSLNELTEAAVAQHYVLARERGLVLEHRPAEPEPMALGDPNRMVQVLNNLMENAIRFTPGEGTVVISTGVAETEGRTWATVTVADTGMGIPQEEIPLIFDRFFRGEKPRTMQLKGTGLGLAIVQEIVELHGGQVTVESEDGAGSAFTVWLPLAD